MTRTGDASPARGSRLLYICDWLPPDFGAVGQYSQIFARDLAAEGHEVTLAGLSSAVASDVMESDGPAPYRVLKLKAQVYDKTSTLKRLAWTAAVNTRLLLALWPEMRKAETILFTGSPPLFLHWIAPANLLLRKKLIYRISDFHPECAMAASATPSLALKLLYRLTLFWRRRVDGFEVLGHDQARRLADIGIAADRVRFKPDPSPVAIEADTEPLPRPDGTEGKTLLLYSGNWGVAHDTATFVEGYRRHHRDGNGRVVLWLNAVGGGAKEVEAAVLQQGLPLVRGSPVPLDQLASLLVTPDAHLITLSDAFVGYVLPSKVYGCVASKKPVLFIGSAASDVHRICTDAGDGRYGRVDVGDATGVAAALDRLGAASAAATAA